MNRNRGKILSVDDVDLAPKPISRPFIIAVSFWKVLTWVGLPYTLNDFPSEEQLGPRKNFRN